MKNRVSLDIWQGPLPASQCGREHHTAQCERGGGSSCSVKPGPPSQASTLITSCNPNSLPKAGPPNTITISIGGVTFPAHEFREGTTHSNQAMQLTAELLKRIQMGLDGMVVRAGDRSSGEAEAEG